MTLNLKTLGLAATLGLAGCQPSGEGRLVGYVVDAVSGEPVNLFKANGDKANVGDDANSKSQVYAVIDGQFRRARPCGTGDLNGENAIQADGCFQLEGIPAGLSFPIVAQLEGYARFQTTYTAPLPQLRGRRDPLPARGQHPRLPRRLLGGLPHPARPSWARRSRTREFSCQYLPAQGNDLSAMGNFLPPENTISKMTVAVTDATGVAVVPGAELVLGAQYVCLARMEQPVSGRILVGAATFIAGVTQPDLYAYLDNEGARDDAPFVVRSNVDNPFVPVGAGGSLVMTFNRPVEFVPGTADCQVANLIAPDTDADGNTGALVANVAGNNESEQVSASISADGLTLTLGARALSAPMDLGDSGVWLEFHGVALRARGAGEHGQIRYLGGGFCAAISNYPNVRQLVTLLNGAAQDNAVLLY